MMKCWYNCGIDITFDDGVIGKTGRRIPLNLDGTRHDCPNSPYKKRVSQTQTQQSEPTVTTADRLQQKEKVNDAIKYIDGLKERVPDFELELIVNEKGVV